MGRRSSVVQDCDSYYNRDLSYGPVSALGKVIGLIRDGQFFPDASRANYFPQKNPMCAGTPFHVLMQPQTPGFRTAAPGTPTVAKRVAIPGESSKGVDEVDIADGWEDVKQEEPSHVSAELLAAGVIDIASDIDSSDSDSGSEVASADAEELCDEPVVEAPNPVRLHFFQVQVRKDETGVVHECCERFSEDLRAQLDFETDVKGCATTCGRIVDCRFSLHLIEVDWTNRCRVCYKGSRDARPVC